LAAEIEDPESPCNFSCTLLIAQQCASPYLKPIKITKVLSHIKQLNPAKSNGPERIHYLPTSGLDLGYPTPPLSGWGQPF